MFSFKNCISLLVQCFLLKTVFLYTVNVQYLQNTHKNWQIWHFCTETHNDLWVSRVIRASLLQIMKRKTLKTWYPRGRLWIAWHGCLWAALRGGGSSWADLFSVSSGLALLLGSRSCTEALLALPHAPQYFREDLLVYAESQTRAGLDIHTMEVMSK